MVISNKPGVREPEGETILHDLVAKSGFEQVVTAAAREHGVLYGLATAMMALATGWLASVVFRRD